MNCIHRAHNGFTLIEFMIAMTLGLILITGIIQVYLSSKKSYLLSENFTQLQEEGDFALDLISREIKMAGFQIVANARNIPAPMANAIVGGDSTGPNGSDLVGVSYTSNTDCAGTVVGSGVAVNAYFLAPGANGRSALFCNATELVANIDNLQVAFGEDTDGDFSPEHYVPADKIADMSSVVAVRVALLIRSDAPVSQALDLKTYRLAGVNVGPYSDRHIRRIFASTIKLRNCLRAAC